MLSRLLMVHNENENAQKLIQLLNKEGFQTFLASSGKKAMELADNLGPDLILSGTGLPDMSGTVLCQQIRPQSDTPFVLISDQASDYDVIQGLEDGADDYIVLPCSPGQIIARLKAQLRRYYASLQNNSKYSDFQSFNLKDLTVDPLLRSVRVHGKPVQLSNTEFDILMLLLKNTGKTVSLDELFEQLWGFQSFGDTRTLVVHISNLRKKIEPDPAKGKLIKTVRGIGYQICC